MGTHSAKGFEERSVQVRYAVQELMFSGIVKRDSGNTLFDYGGASAVLHFIDKRRTAAL
jgi:hypothetical protein